MDGRRIFKKAETFKKTIDKTDELSIFNGSLS